MPDESLDAQHKGDPSDDVPSSDEDDALLAEARDALKTQVDSNSEGGLREKLPKRIGQYRIVSILGQGGMGTVFEAEQEHPKRAVALKVVRGGRFVDEHYVRLFQREAQTLARLKHPGIATIYEAGCTEDGQHFFAMELVRGVLLNRYVRDKKLRIRPRLRLFRRICDAINYAHQRGVIHRDLKPSNILIDEEGRPKILDFGLARITDGDVALATIVTEVGKIQGTLAYMSPEQARGNPDEIDLRSDVYSLGVILYELLTGSLPYNVEHSILHEAVRSICEDEPRKPTSIDASLRGDLETIILKALAKEPSLRYHSAAALAEDIERYLTSQPILAQRPSTLYQLRKLVARHKAAFAFMAILFVLVSAFGIKWRSLAKAATEQSHLARAAERIAQEQAETAGEVKEFLIRLFDISDPNIASQKTPTLRAFLDRGAEKIDEELKGQAAVRATLMDTIGRVYRNLGLYDAAVPLLREALEIREKLYLGDHPDVAESLHNLGWLLRIKGDYTEAEQRVRSALEMRHRLLAVSHPGASRAAVAQSLLILGTVNRYQGRYEDAVALIHKALGIQRELLKACTVDEDKRDIDLEVARCLETLAEALEEKGDYAKAEEAARDGLKRRQARLPKNHPYIASTREVLTLVLRNQGKYQEAEGLARDVLDIYGSRLDDEHPIVAQAFSTLGSFLRDQRRLAEAEEPLRRATNICRTHLPLDHPYVALTATNLAWLLFDTGKYAEAETRFSEALTLDRVRMGTDHPKVGEPLRGLGQTKLARGDTENAESLLRDAVSIYRKAPHPKPWSIAITESVLGDCLVKLRRYDEAEELVLRSHETMRELRGSGDRYVKEALQRIVDLYEAWGKPNEAAKYETILTEPVPAERSAHESEGAPTRPGN